MKKSLFIVALVAVAIVSGVLINQNYHNQEDIQEIAQVKKYKVPKGERLAKGLEWRTSKLINPETGRFEVKDLYAAINRADYLKNLSAKSSGVLNLEWELLGPDNQGGRTRALIFDNQVPNKLWAGSVGGGLFQSVDNGNTWTRVVSYDGYFPIASMTQGSDGALYVGTGEGLGNSLAFVGSSGYNSQSAGNGVFKSTDGGATWYQLPQTNDLNDNQVISGSCTWCGVNALAVSPIDPNLVFAGTESGLKIATDGGETLTSFTDASGFASSGQIQAITIAEDGQSAFIVRNGTTYRSLDVANNFLTGWTQVPSVVSGTRADVKIAPSNPNYVYISVSASNNCLSGIWRSTDGGDTFTEIQDGGTPYTLDPFNQPTATFGTCSGQGWYDHTLAINPVDENKIYIGGITLYTWGDGYGFKRADIIDTEGGTPFDSDYIHADKHKIIFDPQDETGNRMLIGSDGGVTLCTNANSGFPDNLVYIQKNKGYATLQVYGMGAGAAGEVFSGNQDNGSQYIDGLGSSVQAAQEVSGGDGIYAEISNFDPDVLFCGSYYGLIYRSSNRGASYNSFVDANIDRASCGKITCSTGGSTDCSAMEDAPFVYPFYLLETSSIEEANQDSTALLIARDDTLLLATGATQIIRETFYPTYSETLYTTITEDGETDSIYVDENPSYQAVSKVSDKLLVDVTLTSTVFPGDTQAFKDPYDAKYFVTSDCNLWMCTNPLQTLETPKFYRVSSSNSDIYGFDASQDGEHLFYVAGSSLYRVTGLNNVHQILDEDGCYNATCTQGGLTVTQISIPSSFTLEGVAVDKNDANNVLVTAGGFGAIGKVFKVENALSASPTVTPLQTTDATLPYMPIYDCIIDKANSDRFILGTELGIWTSDDGGLTWSEDNNGLFGRIPVYRLRQEWLYTEECMVIYAGTHGGGMFRTTTLTEGSCYTEPYDWKLVDDDFVGINDVADNEVFYVNLYPNAVSAIGNLTFNLSTKKSINLRIVNLTGKVIANENYDLSAGEQTIQFNARDYAPGNYFAVISAKGKVLSTKQFIKR